MMALLLALVCSASGCQESRGSIKGRVTDESGKAVAEAVVRAERNGFPGILLRTDEEGYYSINNIDTGNWNVEFFDASGWLVGLESVTVIADETITLDFIIGAKPLPDDVPCVRINNVP